MSSLVRGILENVLGHRYDQLGWGNKRKYFRYSKLSCMQNFVKILIENIDTWRKVSSLENKEASLSIFKSLQPK